MKRVIKLPLQQVPTHLHHPNLMVLKFSPSQALNNPRQRGLVYVPERSFQTTRSLSFCRQVYSMTGPLCSPLHRSQSLELVIFTVKEGLCWVWEDIPWRERPNSLGSGWGKEVRLT